MLPGISTEQLRSRLNRMVADGMLTRKRYREVPPRVDYALTDRARDLMPVLGELARWGYEWAWSLPRGSESIDLGAIFRLAPGLIRGNGATGIVEFVVTGAEDDEGPMPAYALTLSEGLVTLEESAARARRCPRSRQPQRLGRGVLARPRPRRPVDRRRRRAGRVRARPPGLRLPPGQRLGSRGGLSAAQAVASYLLARVVGLVETRSP